MKITCCPMSLVEADTRAAVELMDYATEMSVFPVAGGSLDQTDSFMSAFKFFKSECGTWEAHKTRERARGLNRN